jgi:hypothetical protein
MGGITITDIHMSSPDTPHTAPVTGGGWEVSWLPGRTLDRNQAITAMVIASTVGGNGVPRADDPIWLYLDGWAAELSLTAPSAVVRASEPPVADSRTCRQRAPAEPFGGSRLCAHADRDGKGARWLAPGQMCQDAETSPQLEART